MAPVSLQQASSPKVTWVGGLLPVASSLAEFSLYILISALTDQVNVPPREEPKINKLELRELAIGKGFKRLLSF